MRIDKTDNGWVIAKGYWIFTQYLHMNDNGYFWWASYFWSLKCAYTETFIEARERAIKYELQLYKAKLEARVW